jgi:hypothetical protein
MANPTLNPASLSGQHVFYRNTSTSLSEGASKDTNDTNSPSRPNAFYQYIEPIWMMTEDLMGGTRAMRAAGQRYLPKEKAESQEAYTNRTKRSFLFNGFRKTVRSLAAKPFRKPITVGDDVPDDVAGLMDNVDNMGNALSVFAPALMQTFMQYGAAHILVDMPALPEGSTQATVRAAGARPYWIAVSPLQLIGWRHSIGPDGSTQLDQIRILETVTEPSGDFGDVTYDQVRVISREDWQIYRRKKTENAEGWTLHQQGPNPLKIVPLASAVWGDANDVMVGEVPLEDLAWLNVEHWQSSSDQRHILHVARVPILHWSGAPMEDDGNIEIGPNRIVRSPDASSKLEYVEHTGAAIQSGRQDIEDIEQRMALMGLELITRRSGDATATEASIDEARADSQLGLMVEKVSDLIENAMGFTMLYLGGRFEDGGSISIFNEFSILANSAEMARLLLEMRKGNEISRQTFLDEVRRRGILPDDFDAEAEIATIEQEIADQIARMGLGDNMSEDDDGQPGADASSDQ